METTNTYESLAEACLNIYYRMSDFYYCIENKKYKAELA